MRWLLLLAIMLSTTLLLSAQPPGPGAQPASAAPAAMTLTIPGFPDGCQIPVQFSQAGPGAAPGEGT
jgi:hypothetical protein